MRDSIESLNPFAFISKSYLEKGAGLTFLHLYG